ncbi:MAG TPA: sulfite exporter TauE/SafE family protein [Stellaceae bacterium]|jgi:uncharacterized membrane protein YfcA
MAAPFSELIWLAAAIVISGIVTGLLAGLFGIGGGAVIVPVLFEAFRVFGVPETVRFQLCVGTSLAIIVPTAIRSYRAHRARGLVVPDVLGVWTLPAVLGVGAGSVVAAFAPEGVFKIAFVAIAAIIAAKLLLGGDSWVLADELPGRSVMSFWGFLIGLGSSLMGISGGSLATMVLTLYKKPIHNAVATAAGIGVPITIAGTIGYVLAGLPRQHLLPPLSIGFVSVIGVILIAPISSAVAPLGARFAHALPKRRLEIGFGLFLLAVSARFAASLIG